MIARVVPRFAQRALGRSFMSRPATAASFGAPIMARRFANTLVSEEVTTPTQQEFQKKAAEVANDPDFQSTVVQENPFYSASGKTVLKLGITERAVARLHKIATEDQNPDTCLRIVVESGGCHGFQYELKLTDLSTKTEEDSLLVRGAGKVLIDESSLQILRDSKVDYTRELIGSQFKVLGGYISSSCGCGSSFDFDFDKVKD